MSDGDRSEQRATLGGFGYFAAIVLCCFIVGGLTYGLGRQNERRQQTPTAYAQAAKADAQRACIGREGAAAFECVYEKVEAAQAQAHDEQDLTAQQVAANSALLSSIVAFFTLILSGFGVWYVRRTLEATLEAVEDTGKATEAMQEANRIARHSVSRARASEMMAKIQYRSETKARTDSEKRQLRAYMMVDHCTIEMLENNEGFVLQATLKNCGTTPAYKAGIMGESFADDYPMSEERPFPDREEGYTSAIGPGQTIAAAYRIFSDNALATLAETKRGKIGLYIQGTCGYTDIYGSEHTTKFRYVFGGRVSELGLVLHAAKTGNDAT